MMRNGYLNCAGSKRLPFISPRAKTLLLTGVLSTVGLGLDAQALPQGEQVTHGDATLTRTDTSLTIDQQSTRAVIEYDSFSVAAHEQVTIQQPSDQAVLLNKVVGNDLSRIDGQINANGQVFLVNPQGVVFGEGSYIQTGGLVVSTLDIDSQQFMNNELHFTGTDKPASRIENQGTLTINNGAGNAELALIAPVIINDGDIEIAQGRAALLSASAVLYQPQDSSIGLLIEDTAFTGSIINAGTIQASQVQVSVATTNALHSKVIDNTGTIRATGAENTAGGIIITGGSGDIYQQGTLDVSAQQPMEQAGTISLTANRIAHMGTINADGYTPVTTAPPTSNDTPPPQEPLHAGGQVELQATEMLVLHNGSSISANAGDTGDGGTIIAYSPNTTLFRQGATLSARGGTSDGDGGFIEVSGITRVEFQGIADASANNGNAGEVYIDPIDILIQNLGTDNTYDGTLAPDFTWDPNGTTGTAIIDPNSIIATLATGSSVTINTATGSGGTGNITFVDTLDYNGITNGAALHFIADGNIVFLNNGNIIDSNPTSAENVQLSFTAGGNITLLDTTILDAGSGTLSLTAGGNAQLSGLRTNNSALNAIDITVGGILTDAGDIQTDISNPNGGLRINAAGNIDVDTDIAFLDLTTTGSAIIHQQNNSALDIQNISVNGNLWVDGVGTQLTLSDTTFLLGGDVTLATVNDADLQLSDAGLTTTGNISILAGTMHDSDAVVSLSANNANLQLTQLTAATQINSQFNSLNLTSNGSSKLTINNTGNLQLQTLAGTSDLQLNNNGTLLLPDTGISFNGNLLELNASDMSAQSNRNLLVNANNLLINITAATNAINLTTNASQLDAALAGPGNFTIMSNNSLQLRDLNNDNVSAQVANGNLSITTTNGDLLVDNDVAATDTNADTMRTGMIELAALNGNLVIGSLANTNITSNNLVDQTAVNGLGSAFTGSPSQTAIYIHLGDNSTLTRQITLGNNTTNTSISAIGGDIFIDALGNNLLTAPTDSNLTRGNNLFISSKNQATDANTGNVFLENDITTSTSNIVAGSGRAIGLRPYSFTAPVVPPTAIPTINLSGLISDQQSQLQQIKTIASTNINTTPAATVNKTFDALFGSCVDVEKKQTMNCALHNALKAFLSKWTLGGELPPKMEKPHAP